MEAEAVEQGVAPPDGGQCTLVEVVERAHGQSPLAPQEVPCGLLALLDRLPALLWVTDLDLRFTSLTGTGLRATTLSVKEYAGKPVEAPQAAAPKPALQGQAMARASRPSTPTYQRAPSSPTSFERSARNFCVNCGTVQAITAFDMGQWEVRVRFEDGSMETLRYPTRPALRIGQSVLLEEGRLIPQ